MTGFYKPNSRFNRVTRIWSTKELIKQFNTIGYEGSTGWELSFIETDVTSIGVLPAIVPSLSTSLQLSGDIPNTSISGESTIFANEGDVITWIITAAPISTSYKFNNPTNVALSGFGLKRIMREMEIVTITNR